MSSFTITITDEATGEVVGTHRRVDPKRCGTHVEPGLSLMDRVLLVAAPQVCPWDCDFCR